MGIRKTHRNRRYDTNGKLVAWIQPVCRCCKKFLSKRRENQGYCRRCSPIARAEYKRLWNAKQCK